LTRRYSVEFTPAAKADLLDLYDYIEEHSSATRAFRYVLKIEKFVASLRTFPERGVARDDIRNALRVIGFERRISIAFVVAGNKVIILRILYAGRNVDQLLSGI
jgi:toxin ParE1/3/4